MIIVCYQDCCPGCQDCYGMSIGCHQQPCRCKLPCTCRWKDEDNDPQWRLGCERHDDKADDRRLMDVEPDYDIDNEDLAIGPPCEECGASGACGYDTEGRAYIHV